MNRPAFDLTPFLQQDEGQHFDRNRRGHRSYVSDRGELGTDRGELGTDRGELGTDRGELGTDRGERGTDRGERGADRGERGADRGELSPELRALVNQLGPRPRKERLRAVIATICAHRDWTTPADLARWLDILPANLTERHLSPMVQAGQLERRFPDTPTHAEQAYRSCGGQLPLGLSRKDPE